MAGWKIGLTVSVRLTMLALCRWCVELNAPDVAHLPKRFVFWKPVKMSPPPPILEVYSDVHKAQAKQRTRLYVMKETAAGLQRTSVSL